MMVALSTQFTCSRQLGCYEERLIIIFSFRAAEYSPGSWGLNGSGRHPIARFSRDVFPSIFGLGAQRPKCVDATMTRRRKISTTWLRLRQALEAVFAKTVHVHTAHGAGYKLLS